MNDRDDWVEITTHAEFERRVQEDIGVIINADSTGAKAHGPKCRWITPDDFRGKVLDRDAKGGRYFWAPDPESALRGGAQICRGHGEPLRDLHVGA